MRFGISDDSLELGAQTLCSAYARKLHMQIVPLVVNILKKERKTHAE